MGRHDSRTRVLVTGAHGFVGRSVMDYLEVLAGKIEAFTIPSHRVDRSYDLTREKNVRRIFDQIQPEVVIHLAGQVGGINANKMFPGSFYYRNTMMGTLVFEYARQYDCNRLIALAAGCGYPAELEAPFTEDDFFSGMPDMNSYGYSMAKKNLVIQSMAYREQYGFDSTILLPANLYGPHDNFNLETSHVVPALIRKFVEAKRKGARSVMIWGSGQASREFLYVKDAAAVIVDMIDKCHETGPFNLGTGLETTIMRLVHTISQAVGFEGEVEWDTTKPDGQIRRYYDMSKLRNALGWVPSTPLIAGIRETVKWFENEYQGDAYKNMDCYR